MFIAASGCAAFTPSYQYSDVGYQVDTNVDASTQLPVLCTNSAPLARSNVTSYDTSRQIQLSTPSAGLLTGYRDRFSFRFLGIKYAQSTNGSARFQPPTALSVEPGTEVSALEYGNFCPQVC